jgi:cytidylate kinase
MKIITIDREFGAGGHTVGWAVAKRLGVEFYDRDIIKEASRASGVDPSLIDQQEESMTAASAFIKAINPVSYDDKDLIFTHESKAIVKLAGQGPCVILGRCATAILQDAGFDVLSVFLHADEEHRIAAAGKILGLDDPAAIRHKMRKRDAARRAWTSCYSDQEWGDVQCYDLALDTGTLGMDACVDIVCLAAQE